MRRLEVFILPEGFSEKNPALAFQIMGLNIVEKTEAIDEENPFRLSHSYTLYTNKEQALLPIIYNSLPDEIKLQYQPTPASFPEGSLDDRIVQALIVTCPSKEIGRVSYFVRDDEIAVRLAAFIIESFYDSLIAGYYSGHTQLPKIDEKFIKEIEKLLELSDISKLSDISPELLKMQILKFFKDYEGHEFFNAIWDEEGVNE